MVWICFLCLSIEYFREEFMMKVGRPIRIDDAMSITSKGKFSRMYVEVDITKRLLGKFRVSKNIRHIKYEGLYLICFHFGIYGHKRKYAHLSLLNRL